MGSEELKDQDEEGKARLRCTSLELEESLRRGKGEPRYNSGSGRGRLEQKGRRKQRLS